MEKHLLKLSDLQGMLPKPLPQTRVGIKNFILRHKDIFRPVVMSHKTGTRYYIPEENVEKFIKDYFGTK